MILFHKNKSNNRTRFRNTFKFTHRYFLHYQYNNYILDIINVVEMPSKRMCSKLTLLREDSFLQKMSMINKQSGNQYKNKVPCR